MTIKFLVWLLSLFSLLLILTAGSLRAEMIDCNSSAIVEIINRDQQCHACHECPPAHACITGYSCQPDIIEPTDGELQQNPPAAVEAWVQSITGGGLVNVPLDDRRWGNREKSEAYARENENFIVWYWPNGGEATFDPTTLGTQAMWHDFRIASGKSGGGGPMPISADMQIFFRDSRGGISIFERISDVLAVGECSDFLTEYINPEQHKLPAHRVYPMGQKMMITAWGAQSRSDLDKLKNSGFTMQGPIWNTGDISYLETVKDYGLRAAHRVYTGSNSKDAALLSKALKDPAQRTSIVKRMKYEIQRVIKNPVYNSVVDIWLTGAEELSARGSALNTAGNPKASGWDSTYNELWYLDQFQKSVNQYDPQKRPLWMSDVTGTNKAQMTRTHRYLAMVGPQVYLGRINPNGGGYTTDAVMGSIARTIAATAETLNTKYPKLRPHAATASLDLYYEPIPSRDTPEMLDKITEHWIYVGLNNGLQGFQLYAWYNYPAMDKQTKAWMKAAYLKHVKRLTDHGLDYAYLWGDRRDDLDIEIVSGPAKAHGYPSISMANIQYGKERFVMLANSVDSPVQVKISGIPTDCVKALDIRAGKHLTINGSIMTTIEPLGVRLYKISKG